MVFNSSIASRLNPFLFPGNHQTRIVNYHNVYDDNSLDTEKGISASVLKKQIQWLKRSGYSFISAKEALQVTKTGKKIYRCIIFTTDDGHLDNWNVMAPIFDYYSIKPILFINSGNIGKQNCMGESEIKDLISRGYEIGSHTVSHVNCIQMNDSIFDKEIVEDIHHLRERFNEPVKYFAFPYGRVFADNIYIKKLYNEGIEMCLSVRYMFNNNLSPLCWGRDKGEMSFNKFLLSFHCRPYILSILNSCLRFDTRSKAISIL